jgi:peptide chain release factor
MNNNRIQVMFTAGRGPIECSLAVKGITDEFKKYLDGHKIGYEMISQKNGEVAKSIETIMFEVRTDDRVVINPWLGTIQWICQSPVRKYNKRKNWYVKCEQITIDDDNEFLSQNVTCQYYRASGPGGQHRNKVETAVRLHHKESGLIITSSDGKSQHQNKKKAWDKLNKKIAELGSQSQQIQSMDRWISQIEIERGNPCKVFVGEHFRER